MSDGRLEQYGTPEEIYRRPATEFVASFVGKPRMNLMDAVVDKQGTLSIPDSQLTAQATPDLPERVRLGVRAENVRLSRKPDDGTEFSAKVRLIEPIGAATDLTVITGSVSLKVPAWAFEDYSVGDEVWIGFHESNLHLFDTQSGARLEVKRTAPVPKGQERAPR